MTGEQMYDATCEKLKKIPGAYHEVPRFDSLSLWDQGCWERYAKNQADAIVAAIGLLRENGYSVEAPWPT